MNPGRGCRCSTCPIIREMRLVVEAARAVVGKGQKRYDNPAPATLKRDRLRAALAEFDRQTEHFVKNLVEEPKRTE